MESANKYEVQQGTDRLANINEDKALKIEELRAANAMNLEGMKDFVKNNRKEAPKAPDANASLDAVQQYQGELGSYNEMKSVLDRFDAQISALKTNYEKSKGGLKEATKDELAKLEATLGIEQKAADPVAAPAATPVVKEEPKASAAKPEEAKDGKAADAPKADSKPTPEAAAKPEAKEAPKTAEYVVKKGDNLTKIAKEHGTTVDALAKENQLGDDKKKWNHILVGQKLKVPAKAEAKPASDTEAAAASKPAAKPEAGKDGKAADGKPEEGKDAKKVDAKVESAPKVDAKAGETPSVTTTLADKSKVETAAKPATVDAKNSDVQAPAGRTQTGALGGTK